MGRKQHRGATPSFKVIRLLWRSARLRSLGRGKRQKQLAKYRKDVDTEYRIDGLQGLGYILSLVANVTIHVMFAWILLSNITSARLIDEDQQGRFVVEHWNEFNKERFAERQSQLEQETSAESRRVLAEAMEDQIADATAYHYGNRHGLSMAEAKAVIIAHYRKNGIDGFIGRVDLQPSPLDSPRHASPTFWLFATVMFGWWLFMLVCQGEGLEMDIQRRRHPHWEWLFSHPISTFAAFSAEILAPMMINSIYITAPLFWGMILLKLYTPLIAVLGALVIGFSFAFAASCLNKAIETAVVLRVSPRKRGLCLGLMSWFGFVSMFVMLFVGISSIGSTWIARLFNQAVQLLPIDIGNFWPGRLIIAGWGEQPNIIFACITAVSLAGCMVAVSAVLLWWGTRNGLQANDVIGKVNNRDQGVINRLVKNPSYRKELLWLWRDKGAVIQMFLFPLTMAGLQVFNLRNIALEMSDVWRSFCGLAVVFGSYLLVMIGPRSLNSEGESLWIALTWPKGLEDILKAKARLWHSIATAIVFVALIVALFLFAEHWWKILLVGIGWYFFSLNLSMKACSLVNTGLATGEPNAGKDNRGRMWIAMLGSMSFSAGVFMGNWQLAMIGVSVCAITASAMWENLRFRLPYLFDRWSEERPPMPSLLYAAAGAAILIELVGTSVAGTGYIEATGVRLMTHLILYGAVGLAVWIGLEIMFAARSFSTLKIWRWRHPDESGKSLGYFLLAPVLGGLLGAISIGYLYILQQTNPGSGWANQSIDFFSQTHIGLVIVFAVLLKPFAEEYVFRGLLYRGLNREWGHMKAMFASAAFFTVYQPVLFWPPMFCVALLSAWVFQRSGRLLPSLLLHICFALLFFCGQRWL